MGAGDEFPGHDRVLRDWFAARGWPVTETFDFDARIRAWRHRRTHERYTLYVDKEVLERNEPHALPQLLDQRFAEDVLRELPGSEAILRYGDRLLVLRYFEGRDE